MFKSFKTKDLEKHLTGQYQKKNSKNYSCVKTLTLPRQKNKKHETKNYHLIDNLSFF